MSKKHIGSSLSSFLDEMKIREETELLALKKTLALQLRQAMKRRSSGEAMCVHLEKRTFLKQLGFGLTACAMPWSHSVWLPALRWVSDWHQRWGCSFRRPPFFVVFVRSPARPHSRYASLA